MEKYNSKNASYPQEDGVWYPNPDAPELVGKVEYPHIIFNNEDGKCGMKVSLEEIVDVWLERVEPERQQTLELEETTRKEKRELATLREKKERREEDDKRGQVHNMMKPFLANQLLDVLSNRGLEITKTNIRNLIGECREKSWYHSTKYQYNPLGILFTEKEWDEFKEDCNKIIMNGNPKNWVGIFDDYENAVKHSITTYLTELRDTPISFWK